MAKGAVVEIDPIAEIAKMMKADGSMPTKNGWKDPSLHQPQVLYLNGVACGARNSDPKLFSSMRLSGTYQAR